MLIYDYYCVPQTVCNMRLDTLEEWYQEANVSTILLTKRKPKNEKKYPQLFHRWTEEIQKKGKMSHF